MKIIDKQEGILISDIDPEKHIVVGINGISHNHVVLTQTDFYKPEKGYKLLCLDDSVTMNNGYGTFTSIREAIEVMDKVEVFTDWREAFKWLMEQ